MCGVQLLEVEGRLPVSSIYSLSSDAVRSTWTTVCVQSLYLPAPSEACRPEQAMTRVTTRTQTRHTEGAMARRRLGHRRYWELLIPCPHPHWGGGASPTWSHVGGAVTSRCAVNKIHTETTTTKNVLDILIPLFYRQHSQQRQVCAWIADLSGFDLPRNANERFTVLSRRVAKLREKKTTINSVMPVRLSVRPSTWNNSAPTGWIFLRFDIWVFFENMPRKTQVSWTLWRLTTHIGVVPHR